MVAYYAAGQRLTAAGLNANLPQGFSACTFLNGWSNKGAGRANLAVRFEDQVTVRLIGSIQPGTLAGGTVFAVLPGGGSSIYAPSSQLAGEMNIVTGTGTGNTLPIWIYTNGNIGLVAAALAATPTELYINCTFPIDI